ncbi:hypothetical protein BD833_11057 [Blastococcus xanthinilyticus]|uniref:Uncharacterized protein n=2 Tax=Blastococcus xanthinilyticus TaxID=1564164 RepID=A0A5S5CQY6_9ACTN|nr:hypothetical protein BD833_11057 [Blastococcus xanthinilyticus]
MGAPTAASAAPVEDPEPRSTQDRSTDPRTTETRSTEPRSTVGYDVSHPQCGADLPEDAAFAVVGVNGGLATRTNPCLAEQLEWAADSSGAVRGQPPLQLYLNTANPGRVRDLVTTWPDDGETPYGDCDGGNSMACSWQYGWERAQTSVQSFFRPAARSVPLDSRADKYTWWLDVETMNTWQAGSDDALARNRATLEGMTEYLTERDGEVGLYSTGYQWGRIVGEVPEDSPLAGLPSWLAGADDRADARDRCDEDPLVPDGRVSMVQYIEDDLDHNHSCR